MYTIVKTAGDIIVMSRVLEIFGCWNIGRVMRVNIMLFEYFFFVIFHPNLTFNMPEKLEENKKITAGPRSNLPISAHF